MSMWARGGIVVTLAALKSGYVRDFFIGNRTQARASGLANRAIAAERMRGSVQTKGVQIRKSVADGWTLEPWRKC